MSMNLSDQAKRAYSQLPMMVSRIRQSMKSPGIFHLSRGIRNSSTRKFRRITGNRQSIALVSEVERWYLNLPQLYLLNHNGT